MTQTMNGELESDRYGEFNYHVSLSYDDAELGDLNKRYNAAKKEIEEVSKAAKTYATKLLKLPHGFTVTQATFDYGSLQVVAYTEKLRMVKPKQVEAPKPKRVSPLDALKSHPNFVQIINSGILTREEKRKVLGLPKLKVEA